MAKKKKKTSPSRKKYDRNNPVVSCRLSMKEHDVLQATKKKEGRSNADIMKVGLGLTEVKVRSEKEIRRKAYREGHIKGYELAQSIYKVTFPCAGCRREIEVRDDATKKAIREYMIRDGWGHAECVER